MAKDLTKKDIEYLSEVIDSQYIPDKWKKKAIEIVNETKSESKEPHSTNSKLDMLYRVLKSKYENQGMSLKQIYDEVINMQGIKDGALIFSEFVKRKKEEGDKRFIYEFNKTSFVENIHSKTKPTSNLKDVKGEPKVSFRRNKRTGEKTDTIIVDYKGDTYYLLFSADGISSEPYGLVINDEEEALFINKNRKANSIWNKVKKYVYSFLEKKQLERALKGIEVAIDIAGETKELMKAKKGTEMAINLI